MATDALAPEAPDQDNGDQGGEDGHPFYPFHVIDTLIIVYLLGGLLLTLAIFHPFHLHEPADPLKTPEGIKPEWYFLPMYQAIKYIPPITIRFLGVSHVISIGVLATGLVFVVIILWPFLDALLTRRTGRRRLHVALGAVALVATLLLGIVGHVSERTIVFRGQEYHIDLLGIPHATSTEQPAPEE